MLQHALRGGFANASIRRTLGESPRLQRYTFDVYLQGSYANHTNISGDSDVDIVVELESTITVETSRLDAGEKARYQAQRIPATITIDEFRRDVEQVLTDAYGTRRVNPENKCIRVDGERGMIDADVVPALEHRLYTSWGTTGPSWIPGIEIRPRRGGSIINFPKEHIRNGEAKNGRANNNYKPTVRQVKQLCIAAADGELPGYVLECMVFNVPDQRFSEDQARSRLISVMATLSVASVDELRTYWSCDRVHRLFVDDPGDHNPYTAVRVVKQMWDAI